MKALTSRSMAGRRGRRWPRAACLAVPLAAILAVPVVMARGSAAEAITSVPRETITRLGREYATRKPGVLYQGYGLQRRAYGEQAVRAGCVLAAITGNVGIPGGSM